MLKWLFNKYEKQFLEHINKKRGITLTKDNLVFSFHDLDGNGYYKFPKEISLPMARLGKLQEYIMWLSAAINGEELERQLNRIDAVLTEGLKHGKGAAKIGFIVSDLKDRKNMIIHNELFYNMIACQIIRHDESVTDFNNDIQMQKVEAFKNLDSQNDTFFLNIQEFLKALNWSNITREEYQTLLKESIIKREATEKVMQEILEKK